MKGQRYFWNVLRVVSGKLDKEVRHLEDLYNMPVSEADTPEETSGSDDQQSYSHDREAVHMHEIERQLDN